MSKPNRNNGQTVSSGHLSSKHWCPTAARYNKGCSWRHSGIHRSITRGVTVTGYGRITHNQGCSWVHRWMYLGAHADISLLMLQNGSRSNPQQGKQIIVQLACRQNLTSTVAYACWYNSSFTTHNVPRASRMERSRSEFQSWIGYAHTQE